MRAPVGWPTHRAKARAQRRWVARMRRPGAWPQLLERERLDAERRQRTRRRDTR